MKLTVVFLLVTLMVCCYSATAEDVCLPLIDIITKWLFGSSDDYMKAIAPYLTTADMTEAASRLKQCALEATEQDLMEKDKLLKNILANCVEIPTVPLNSVLNY
ncbi:uteroglobin-like [Anolis sagrei]|uniref:uteroglobin-like n=1 Tax=Anolis sagrei TaxID=38937 RepID=UPI003522ED1B